MNTLITLALAAQSGGAQANPQAPPNQGMYMIIMFVSLGLLFWFMILRPQNRERQSRDQMRNNVKKGDKVKTIGGAYGVVTAVDTTNKIVTVQVDKNVKIDFDRDAIQTVIRKDDAKEDAEPKKTVI